MGKGQVITGERIFELLTPLVGVDRLERIEAVVRNRTFNVLPIVEVRRGLASTHGQEFQGRGGRRGGGKEHSLCHFFVPVAAGPVQLA